MKHPRPTIQNTLVIIAMILTTAIFVTTVILYNRLATVDEDRQRALNVGCVATNARFQAIIDGFTNLRVAEVDNSVADRTVRQIRLDAYTDIIDELTPLVRNCDEVYPLPGGN